MGVPVFDKLVNFFLPVEDDQVNKDDKNLTSIRDYQRTERLSRKNQLKGQTRTDGPALKIMVERVREFDDVKKCADYLNSNYLLIIDYSEVDMGTQRRIADFMNGVCYLLEGTVQRIAELTVVYAYKGVEFDKNMFSYSESAGYRREKDLENRFDQAF
ncbi:cell division protein SepF [Selenomonadales bacterium OttesenSCG-928-I06]|nr:cell division protein SepF [Selenomonadales bacterium OttesenSCG-928-I06]